MDADLHGMDVDDLIDEIHDLRSELKGYRSGNVQQITVQMAAAEVFEQRERIEELEAELERVKFERDVLKTNQVIAFGA